MLGSVRVLQASRPRADVGSMKADGRRPTCRDVQVLIGPPRHCGPGRAFGRVLFSSSRTAYRLASSQARKLAHSVARPLKSKTAQPLRGSSTTSPLRCAGSLLVKSTASNNAPEGATVDAGPYLTDHGARAPLVARRGCCAIRVLRDIRFKRKTTDKRFFFLLPNSFFLGCCQKERTA